MHGISLDGSYLSEATHAQLELFYSLPPDVQAKVYLDDFSIEEVRDSRNYLCNFPIEAVCSDSACTASSTTMAPSRSTRTTVSTECARSAHAKRPDAKSDSMDSLDSSRPFGE